MSENKKSLSTEQRRSILALLSCPTITEAAKQSGISERTIYRWLADDMFSAELHAAQADAMSSAVRMLTSSMSTAAIVIKHTMVSSTTPPALRLRAALGLVSVLPSLRDSVDFETRLAALEAAQGAK